MPPPTTFIPKKRFFTQFVFSFPPATNFNSWHTGKSVFVLPEIPYPADQEEGGVPEGDERVLAEEDRLRSHRRLCELREDDPRHARLQKKIHQFTHSTNGRERGKYVSTNEIGGRYSSTNERSPWKVAFWSIEGKNKTKQLRYIFTGRVIAIDFFWDYTVKRVNPIITSS